MRARWLGWAGIELEAGDASAVVDPLGDPLAMYAPLGEAGAGATPPELVTPASDRSAVVGCVTHLHRDHCDAKALSAALLDDALVLEPEAGGGEGLENLGLAQAEYELGEASLERRVISDWETFEAGPFSITALPAVDGGGDPQVSWMIEADGSRILHLGDTIFHGYWWRMVLRNGPFDVVFAPINGAVIDLPHRQPPSPFEAAMTPEQAAVAGEILGAKIVVPIHYNGLQQDPLYAPILDASERLVEAAAGKHFEVRVLEPGDSLNIPSSGDES